MTSGENPRRRPNRPVESQRRTSSRSGSRNSQRGNKSTGEWVWLAVGMGIVLLAGVLFLLLHNSESAETKPVTDESVENSAATTNNSVTQNHGDADSVERSLALQILNLGGRVTVLESGGAAKEIYQADALPAGDFEIDAVRLDGIDAASDAKVASLAELRSVRELGLSKTKVTDAGLVSLQKVASLSSLNLRGCAISDRGLMTLSKMSGLKMIVADGGVSGMSTVRDFGLSSSPQPPAAANVTSSALSDKGIESLAALKGLETLSLVSSQAGDSSLATIADSSRKLVQLRTVGFGITNGGVSKLKNLTNLRVLELSNSLITDSCIETLSQLKSLDYLIVQGTQITPAGVKRLQQNLPHCEVFGGQYDPRLNIIRDIMVAGGRVLVIPDGKSAIEISKFEDLPETFKVVRVNYTGVKSLKLAELALAEVTELNLNSSGVDPFEIVGLSRDYPNLVRVDLVSTAVTDREIAFLSNIKTLHYADFSKTPVTFDGVFQLKRALPFCQISWGIPQPSRDREVAIKLLKLGCVIGTNTKTKSFEFIADAAMLPEGEVFLQEIQTAPSKELTDDLMKDLKGLKHIRWLNLMQNHFSNESLANLEGMLNVEGIHLLYPRGELSDVGLASLAKLPLLAFINLENVPITDAGIRLLGNSPHLTSLNLRGTKITDASTTTISLQFPNIRGLTFDGTSVTEAGLSSLSGNRFLTGLNLNGIPITNNGLETLAHFPALEEVGLAGTRITDASVPIFVKFKKLKTININKTSLTPDGIQRLRQALPDLKHVDDERTASLKLAFNAKIKLSITTSSKKKLVVASMDELPEQDYSIDIMDASQSDLLLTHVRFLETIEMRLGALNAVDTNFETLAYAFPKLEVLDLTGSGVNDARLETISKIKHLRTLNLTGTKCTIAGIARLRAALPKCQIIGP